jgi:hypothetical protein
MEGKAGVPEQRSFRRGSVTKEPQTICIALCSSKYDGFVFRSEEFGGKAAEEKGSSVGLGERSSNFVRS